MEASLKLEEMVHKRMTKVTSEDVKILGLELKYNALCNNITLEKYLEVNFQL